LALYFGITDGKDSTPISLVTVALLPWGKGCAVSVETEFFLTYFFIFKGKTLSVGNDSVTLFRDLRQSLSLSSSTRILLKNLERNETFSG